MLSHSKVPNGWNVAVEAASIKQSRKWPEFNIAEYNAAIRRYGECWSLADLLNSSESWPDDIACRQTEWLIDQLFPGNPRLACGKSMHEISARSREDWRGHLAQQQFIVPNTSSWLRLSAWFTPGLAALRVGSSSKTCLRRGCVHSLVTPQVWGRIQPTGHARSRCACLAV